MANPFKTSVAKLVEEIENHDQIILILIFSKILDTSSMIVYSIANLYMILAKKLICTLYYFLMNTRVGINAPY